MKRITLECQKCQRFISRSNYDRHIVACVGPKTKKIRGVDFDPNIGFKDGSRLAWNRGLTKETNLSVKRQSETLSRRFGSGELKPSGAVILSTEQRRNKAIKQGFGGYNANAGRSKREFRKDSNGKEILLQSSYEVRLADILERIGYKWVRPAAIQYSLDDKQRRYYPDFLINDQFLVDTKNSYLATKDKPKIQAVEEQNNVSIVVLLENDLTEEKVRSLFMVV